MEAGINKEWIQAFSNKSLRLILFATEQCNFRCVYCYEDFLLGNMKAEVVGGVKNLIIKRVEELKILGISFFGGEPLLNKKMVLELSAWAKDISRKHEVAYSGGITTNGYALDGNTFNNLIESGVHDYQVTIDGSAETHDKLRPTINGKPTFHKIMSNMITMSKSTAPFYCTFRLNITDSTIDSVKKLFTDYARHFRDSRFSVHFHPIFGVPELELKNKKSMEDLHDHVISLGLNMAEGSEDEVCYASKADSYVIRADGKVQKCTVATNSEINTLGKIHPDGNMELDPYKVKKWIFAENKGCPLQSLALENLAIPYEEAGNHLQPV